jgi:hypothetical protein
MRQARQLHVQFGLSKLAAIWHNDHTGKPAMRSLIAYDYY